jgi:hypothetical protein
VGSPNLAEHHRKKDRHLLPVRFTFWGATCKKTSGGQAGTGFFAKEMQQGNSTPYFVPFG